MPRTFSIWLSLLVLVCGLVFTAHAQEPAVAQNRGVIKVAKIVGEVYVIDTASSLRERIGPSRIIYQDQVVETGPNSSVVLVLSNGALINVRADSRLEIAEFGQNPFSAPLNIGLATHEPSMSKTRLNLRKGEIISQVKKLNREAGSSFTVETPVGAAGIRGTSFRLGYTSSGGTARFILSMAEGLIQFIPVRGRSVDVPAGKELTFDAQVDATTGAVISIPDSLATTDVPAGELARLQALVLETIAASANVEFTPATSVNGTTADAATVSPDATAPTQTASASGETSSPTSAIGSPPPVPAPPTTSPGAGAE